MGNFISLLSKAKGEPHKIGFFSSNSLSKIKEYYALYRKISDTFAIDDSEFAEIFGNRMDVFQLLDTDKNLLVDGLQLFSGLILLSRTVLFEEKIEFLFSLFDFNNLKSLSKTDLQFMFLSSCSAVHKIFALRGVFDETSTQQFFREEFTSGSRINISEIQKWAKNSHVVALFFEKILPQSETQEKLPPQKIYLRPQPEEEEISTLSSFDKKQEKFMDNVLRIFALPEERSSNNLQRSDISPSLDWVYGIHHEGMKQFLDCVSIGHEEFLLYYIGKIVVILNIKSGQQRHYNCHLASVSSLTANGEIVATGESSSKPQIRIWNSRTLKTLLVIEGTHVHTIHLLKFFCNGDLLISSDCSRKSPILIHDTISGDILFTAFCDYPSVEICLLSNFTIHTTCQFVVASLYNVHHFEVNPRQDTTNKLSIKTSKLRSDDNELDKQCSNKWSNSQKITSCGFVMMNSKWKHLLAYDKDTEKYVLTGHEDGVIFVCNLKTKTRQFFSSEDACEIIRILPTKNHIVVISDSSFLRKWSIDLDEKEQIKVIDTTQLLENLRSYDLRECLQLKGGRWLLMTKAGDLFILGQEKLNDRTFNRKLSETSFQTKVIDTVVPIKGTISSHRLVIQDNIQLLYYVTATSIDCINLHSHKAMLEWNIGSPILAFDANYSLQLGLLVVAGTVQNKLYSQVNGSENANKFNIESPISALMIYAEEQMIFVLVACENRNVYKLQCNKGTMVFISSIRIPQIIVSLAFLEQRVFLLTASNSQVYLLTTRSNQKQMHFNQAEEVNIKYTDSHLTVQYCHKSQTPRQNLPVVVGFAPKSLCAARRNGDIDCWKQIEDISAGNKITLRGHTAPCANLAFTLDQKWLVSAGSKDSMMIAWRMCFFLERQTALTATKMALQVFESTCDEVMQQRLRFCIFENNILSELYDSHLLVRGLTNDTLCKLFKSNMLDWEAENNSSCFRFEPKTSLKLDYVFGMETWHTRNSVIYVSNPKRFVYFVSKLVVLYHPVQNLQSFYFGHKFKVTCITLLADKCTVASGECAYRPTIHIWSTKTLETIRIIQTVHRWGIIELATEDNILLSYGFVSRPEQSEDIQLNYSNINTFSYQLTNYVTGEVLGTRTEKDIVHAMAINPVTRTEFATCSQCCVTFWVVQSNNILRKAVCNLIDDTATCCLYYIVNPNEADLLVGTRSGQLGMISQRKHFISFKREAPMHTKRINCILMIKKEGEMLFMTASEDNTLKLWSYRFEEIFSQDVRKMELEDSFKKFQQSKGLERSERNFAVQSICDSDSDKGIRLLMATRNGEILQMIEGSSFAETTFKYVLYLKSNMSQNPTSSRRRVIFAHHPRFEIVATIGDDHNLLFWDTERRRFIFSSYLGLDKETTLPTAMRFSHNGDYLIIGYSDGLLIFLDSKISKSVQSKSDEKYTTPNLSLIKKEKAEEGHAVLNMQLSEAGDHLAVSYHRITGDSSHSYIEIFVNKAKDKSKAYSKFDSDKIFERFSRVPCPYAQKTYHSSLGVSFGFAAYSMAFAEYEGKYYFLIHYQLLDSSQNRLHLSSEGDDDKSYKVWDVSTSTVIANFHLIDCLTWRKYYIHSFVNCRYQLHNSSLSLKMEDSDILQNNNLLKPQMSNMVLLPGLIIMGSSNGDLHVLRASALHYSNMIDQTPLPSEMCVAKTYPAHSSEINQIQVNPSKTVLYSSGANDQCVMKWIVECVPSGEEEFPYENDEFDIFRQVPSEKFEQQRTAEWQAKEQLSNAEADTIGSDFIEKMQLVDIFGRNSTALRGNVHYDQAGRVVYSSGHALVVFDKVKKSKDLVYLPEDHLFQNIGAICMSKDKSKVYCCHNGTRAGLVVWKIGAKIPIKEMIIDCMSTVLYISVNDNDSRIVVYGINSHCEAYIGLIDVKEQLMLAIASYSHKEAWHIKAVHFVPGSQSRFATCGVEDTKLWTLSGNLLVYQEIYYGIEISKELPVINLCMTFVNQTIITGCDDGSIILWKADPLRTSQHNQMVLTLSCQQFPNSQSSRLVSSGRDNYIVVWVCSATHLQAMHRIDLSIKMQDLSSFIVVTTISSTQANVDNEVQSLSTAKGQILIGMRNGDILEFQSHEEIQDGILTVLGQFQDNQNPKALFFADQDQQLFQITSRGLLTSWDIVHSRMLWSYNFHLNTIGMIYSIRKQIVFIAFDNQVRSFRAKKDNYGNFQLHEMAQNCLSIVRITHIVMSKNQKMLAFGVQHHSDHSRLIEVYDISRETFKPILRIPLERPIQYFDFSKITSKDKAFILVKSEKKTDLWDLNQHKIVNPNYLSQIQWTQKGLIFSEQTQKARKNFSKDHEDVCTKSMMLLDKEKYLLFTTAGGIYIYNDTKMISKFRFNLSDVSSVALAPSRKYLAVSSEINHNVALIDLSRCLSIVDQP